MNTDIFRCRAATTRGYLELRRRGVPDVHAFDAAVRIFSHHCPDKKPEAHDYVAAWLDDGSSEAPA